MSDNDEKELAGPITEDLSKQELVDHMMNVHGIYHAHGNQLYGDAKKTRATKAELVSAHYRLHETLDKPSAEVQVSEGKVFDGTTRYGVPIPPVPHVHTDVTAASHVADAMEAIRNGENPLEGSKLTAGERSALTRLIDNDFNALKNDITALAAQSLATDLAQLELDWKDRRARVSTWTEKVNKLRREMAEQFAEIQAGAAEDGIELTPTRPIIDQLQVNTATSGYAQAQREAKEANKKMLDTAILKLERERLRAQRSVLLTGITPEAQKILDTIPSASRMLGEASAKAAALEAPSGV